MTTASAAALDTRSGPDRLRLVRAGLEDRPDPVALAQREPPGDFGSALEQLLNMARPTSSWPMVSVHLNRPLVDSQPNEAIPVLRAYADLLNLPIRPTGFLSRILQLPRHVLRYLLRPWLDIQSRLNQQFIDEEVRAAFFRKQCADAIEGLHREMTRAVETQGNLLRQHCSERIDQEIHRQDQVLREGLTILRQDLARQLGFILSSLREAVQALQGQLSEEARYRAELEEEIRQLEDKTVRRSRLDSQDLLARMGKRAGQPISACRQAAEEPAQAALTLDLKTVLCTFIQTRLPAPPARVLALVAGGTADLPDLENFGYSVTWHASTQWLEVRQASCEAAVVLWPVDYQGPAVRRDLRERLLPAVVEALCPAGRLLLIIPCGLELFTAGKDASDQLMTGLRLVEQTYAVPHGSSWSLQGKSVVANLPATRNCLLLLVAEKP